MIKTISAADAAKKFAEVTPGRQAYYEAGALAAGADWEKNTGDAAANYKAAVSAGNIDAMFKGGVKKAGAAKYVRKVGAVGAARFSSGIAAGAQDYQTGIEPMLATISAITLPARAPRGSESNIERVRVVAKALHAKRLSLRAAGA